MPDPWSRWDEELKRGEPAWRLAQTLTDVEILVLLSSERGGRRDHEKRMLRDEACQRMQRAQGRNDRVEPAAMEHAEPVDQTYGPDVGSRLPRVEDYQQGF